MKNSDFQKILSETERGYDLIADKFSSTRTFMWRDFEFLKDLTGSEDRVLDFGCGNGRLAGFLEENYKEYVGADVSQKLIDIASQGYSSGKTIFIKIDGKSERLPFEDNYFDDIFSIAVFHHFPSKNYSQKVARELYRVLKPGGKIVVTVWNLWQKQFLRLNLKNKLGWGYMHIPFRAGEKVFKRYHHPFKMGEIEDLFQEVGFKTLKTKEGWNLLYIGQKSVMKK